MFYCVWILPSIFCLSARRIFEGMFLCKRTNYIWDFFIYIYVYKKKTLYFTWPFLKLICEAVINGVFTHMLSGRVYEVCVVSYVHNAYFLYYCRSSLNCCILRWFDLIIKYMRSVWWSLNCYVQYTETHDPEISSHEASLCIKMSNSNLRRFLTAFFAHIDQGCQY